MIAVRRFADDLIEKRLWPVVLALAIALIAIPVLIGRSGEPAGAPDAAVNPASGQIATATPAVELVGPPDVRTRAGELRDPFRRKKVKAASNGKPTATPAAAPAPKAASAPKAGGTSGGAKAPAVSSSPVKPKPSVTVPIEPAAAAIARSVFETVAHVTGPHADYKHPLDRLAVVGDKDSPALQYLGVSRGGEYAIFLLGPNATAKGNDGACFVAQPCRAIALRRGDTLKIAVADPGAAVRDYTVEVTSLRRVVRHSPAAAVRERRKVAEDGREVLRTQAEDVPTASALGQLRYGPATGTVTLTTSR
jgi:hypothetical protein